MQKFDVWEVSTNSDLTEGKGHKVFVAYFTDENQANLAARGIGVWGGNGYVQKATVAIFDTAAEHKKYEAINSTDYQLYLDLKSRFESLED